MGKPAETHSASWHRRLAWAWMLVVALLVAHNVWIWFVEKRAPETDVLALLPADERDPAINEAVKRVSSAAQQHVIVLVGSRDWDSARRAAAAYQAALAKHGDWLTLDSAAAALNPEQTLAPWWARRNALLTATDRRALQSASPETWARAAMQNLNSPLSVGQIGAWQEDPFGLFRHWLQAHGAETPVRPEDGMLRVTDGDMQYVLLPYTLSAHAFSFNAQRAVVPMLDSARRAAAAVPGTRVLTAGLVLFAAEAAQKANMEANVIGWGSLAGILLVMWLTFRSPLPIVLVVVSLAVGTLGALSVSAMLFAKLHLITLVFGSSLVGVAEDYGIHYLCHRIGDRRDPWAVMRDLLPGLTFALLTTGVAYLGLALTPFPGLRQMAVFSAAGLVFAWLTVALWFPLMERRPSRTTRFASWLGATRAKWPVLRRNRATAITGLVAAVVIVAGLSRLTTNDDIRLLQNASQHLIDEQRDVGRVLHATAPSQFYLVSGADADDVLQREERLRARLDSLIARGVLTGYQAASTWVPSLERQQQDQQLVAQTLYGPRGPLLALATALDERPAWADAAAQRLAAPSAPLTIDAWLTSAVSAPARHLWVGKIDGRSASIVALQGVEYAGLSQLQAAAQGLPGITWVDKVADVSALLGRYRREMALVVIASFAAMWILLLPRYGRRSWRMLAPTVIGTLLALAMFGLLGQPLHLFHILATLLILGMGVDYGIFLEEHSHNHSHTAWLAVVISAASTLLSFGLLGLSRTPALQAFGLTMLVGIGTVTIIAPCFCPAAPDLPEPPATPETSVMPAGT